MLDSGDGGVGRPGFECGPQDAAAAKPAFQRRGFYLHGCWKYNYPFAVRSWKPADYHNMFLLLKQLGFNTVMMWPVVEAIPMPLSEADRQAVLAFRPIIEDARKCGLEAWLTLCVVTSSPEIVAKPWMERSLYSHMRTVRLDDPQEAETYLKHRAALLEILNNADGYVTIDGDPGGYPGAKPADFVKVLLNDRKTIDRCRDASEDPRDDPLDLVRLGHQGRLARADRAVRHGDPGCAQATVAGAVGTSARPQS